MKTKHLFLAAVIILFTALQTIAQDAINGKLAAKTAIPFAKKLSAPDFTKYHDNTLTQMFNSGIQTSFMQNISKPRGASLTLLISKINPL